MLRPNPKRDSVSPAQRLDCCEGLYLRELDSGAAVDIETQHHHYHLVKRGDDTHVCISGHPRFCPVPVEVVVEGSFGSRRRLNPHPGFIGLGMYLAFKHPRFGELITTSRIREIHKVG